MRIQLQRILPSALFFYLLFISDAEAQFRTKAPAPAPSDTLKEKVLTEVTLDSKRFTQNEPVGEYKQPVWSTYRRFPSTRIYVQVPKGKAMYEKWMEIRDARKPGDPTKIRMRDELALGLGNRIELDLYLHTEYTAYGDSTSRNTLTWRGFSWEIRYALANWGKIFGNPTLYFEYQYLNNGYRKIEPKILLGGNINPKSIWGLNLVHERELATKKERDEEYKVTASYGRMINNWFSAGLSYQLVHEIERENDVAGSFTDHFIGPSLQFKFHERAYLDVEPLFGLEDSGNKMKTFVIFGWLF